MRRPERGVGGLQRRRWRLPGERHTAQAGGLGEVPPQACRWV